MAGGQEGSQKTKAQNVQKPRRNRGLIVVLVVVVLSIVGLIISIVLNLNHRVSPQMHTEEFQEINELANTLPTEDAMILYQDIIESANNESDQSEALVEYGRFLIWNDMADLALEQLEKVNEDSLDTGYKLLFLGALRDYYYDIGNELLYQEYNDKIGEITANSEYEAGG